MSNVSVRIARDGFEPATSGLWARRAARLLYPATIPARHRYAPTHAAVGLRIPCTSMVSTGSCSLSDLRSYEEAGERQLLVSCQGVTPDSRQSMWEEEMAFTPLPVYTITHQKRTLRTKRTNFIFLLRNARIPSSRCPL